MSKRDDKTSQPMDDSAEEVSDPQAASNNQRTAYGVQTLINEVIALFPETPYEVSGYDGRNTGLDVTFDSTVLDDETKDQFVDLLSLVQSDIRVRSVLAEDGGVLVEFHRSLRVQDSRDSFDLADAWSILTESEDPEGMSLGFGYPDDPDIEFEGLSFDGGFASDTDDDALDGGSA